MVETWKYTRDRLNRVPQHPRGDPAPRTQDVTASADAALEEVVRLKVAAGPTPRTSVLSEGDLQAHAAL